MASKITLQQLRYVIEVAECGSINAASQNLYVSQPTLSAAIKEVERDLGIEVFNRTNRGITPTAEGIEFIGYARQVLAQMDLLEGRYDRNAAETNFFSVSAQHYAFSVAAFIDLCEESDAESYEFHMRETRTGEIIDDVRFHRSELGVLYLSEFNRKVIEKALADANLEFTPLFEADPHVFVGTNHPLADKELIMPEDLREFPRYSFEQGTENSFYYAEEPLAHLPHKKKIYYSDRGTLTNLLTHFNGYTISTGVLAPEMNVGIAAIPLASDEKMTVGYIYQADSGLSKKAKYYISRLRAHIEANPTVTRYRAPETL
jgi:DNA-binding transcriptional LysR family regulator